MDAILSAKPHTKLYQEFGANNVLDRESLPYPTSLNYELRPEFKQEEDAVYVHVSDHGSAWL